MTSLNSKRMCVSCGFLLFFICSDSVDWWILRLRVFVVANILLQDHEKIMRMKKRAFVVCRALDAMRRLGKECSSSSTHSKKARRPTTVLNLFLIKTTRGVSRSEDMHGWAPACYGSFRFLLHWHHHDRQPNRVMDFHHAGPIEKGCQKRVRGK